MRRILAKMHVRRRLYSTLEEVSSFVANELKGSGGLLGYRAMFEKCKLEGFCVRKEDVRSILQELDFESVLREEISAPKAPSILCTWT